MAVYQNSTANLGVKLEITHASPDVANNRTTITYKASVYKTGSHNPKNGFSETPMYLTINGESLVSTASGNYNLEGGTTSQLIKTGTLTIPHGSDGSKSFTFSWNVNFTSTNFPYKDFGYRSVTTSGTYVLPNIARASTFTIPSTTITTGSAFTVTISKASDGFRHKVAYIVGSSENEWTTNANTTYSATIPHSLFNAHKSAESVSGVIRVTTMNGTAVVGSNQRTVTINLTSSATPSLAGVSYVNSNKGMFTGTNQFIRNVSLPTITAGTATGSYSSTISSYDFQTLRGGTVLESISKTTNSQQFGAFNFPNSGSEAKVYMQARVRDSRGRYSAWVKTAEFRVHHYAPPAIGTMTVRRTGSANTTLQVTRNYVVTNMYEGGGTTNSNTASLTFQHRVKGSSTVTANTGAGSTTMTLTKSNANLSHIFATSTSYEVRAILKDKINTVYGSWISVGTEFVPMDIGPKGIGAGKIHSDSGYNLEVGSGGINSEGSIRVNGKAVQAFRITTDSGSAATTVANLSQQASGLQAISTTTTNSPVAYGTVLGLGGFEILIGSDNSARFRRWSGSPSTPGPWLNAMDKDGTLIPSNANLNSYTNTGYYYNNTNAGVATFTNAPTNISAGYMEVYKGGTMTWQRWTNYRGTHGDRSFVRNAEGASWGSWKEIANMSDIPTIPAAYTPTGGGSGNNRWIKFPSGHQICWGTTTTTSSTAAVTLPRAFTATPMITVSGHHASHSPSVTLRAASDSAATFYIVDGRNGGLWGGQYTSGMTATIRYIATGIG